jgi:hypothetical protein
MRVVGAILLLLALGLWPANFITGQERQTPLAPGIAPILPQDPVKSEQDQHMRLALEAKLSVLEAIAIAQRAIAGKPVEVTLKAHQGHPAYQVELIDGKRRSHSLLIDALDGKLLSSTK